MVKIVVENFSEDALRKLYCDYMSMDNKNDDSDDCEVCSLPKLLHFDNSGENNRTCLHCSQAPSASLILKEHNWQMQKEVPEAD